jgi:hypothetical protein
MSLLTSNPATRAYDHRSVKQLCAGADCCLADPHELVPERGHRTYRPCSGNMLNRLCFLLAALAVCAVATPQPCGKRDTLCWQLQLPDDQCSSPTAHPCYNIYALNQSNGQLNWYAYTTSSSGIKGMSVVSSSTPDTPAKASSNSRRLGRACAAVAAAVVSVA